MTRGEPDDRTHSLTVDAPASRAAWTRLLSLDALRYHRSGWWLDAALPRSPMALLIAAFALPVIWLVVGYAITPDRSGYLETHDVTFQIPFFALHVIVLRVTANLWTRGLGPALDGLGIPATGRKVDMPAVSIFTQRGGALGSETFFLDLATLAEQMGVAVDDMRARLALLRPAEPLAQAAGGAR